MTCDGRLNFDWWRRVIGAAVGALALAAGAAAELSPAQRETILAEAQQAYVQGVSLRRTDPDSARARFREAASRYQQLVDDGVTNGALQYNLGNAHFQAGNLGRAIAHYRAALAMMPGDADARHNLEYARSLRESQISGRGADAVVRTLLWWHRQTPFGLRAGLFVAAYLLFWMALSMQVRRPGRQWIWTAVGCAVLWVPLGCSTASHLLRPPGSGIGVIVVDDVIVRKGNGEGFEPQFRQPLHQGVEFAVLERRPGWVEIELPDGKSGWIRDDQALLVQDAIHGRGVTGGMNNPART